MNAHIESTFKFFAAPTDKERNRFLPRADRDKTNFQLVAEALKSESASEFVKDVLYESYSEIFPHNESDSKNLIRTALSLLGVMGGMQMHSELKNAFSQIHTQLLKDKQWFREGYKSYRRHRAEGDFSQIEKCIVGQKHLDYGCGAGYFTQILIERGYEMETTDVLDYRSDEMKKNVKFTCMRDTKDIQYKNDSFDTVFLYHVLHHINPEDLSPILTRLLPIGKRFIIKEDIYDMKKTPEVLSLKHQQPRTKQFMKLPPAEQKKVLFISDIFANIIGQGVLEMNMPFQFKPMDEWVHILNSHGYQVSNYFYTGIESHKLHRSAPQGIIIADRK